MAKKTEAEISEGDQLRMRMARIKGKIPIPFISIYEFKHGELSVEDKRKVRNVWNLRLLDEAIIKNFEKIAKEAK